MLKNLKKSNIKYLGIIIDQHIKWTEHITQTVNRIRKLYYVFLKLRNILHKSLLLKVYYALAQSVLQYGIIGWGGAYKTNLTPLEIVHRRLIKIILKKQLDYSTQKLFDEFKVLPLNKIYQKNALLQIHKDKLTTKSFSTRPRTLGQIIIPKLNTTTAQHHYTYSAIKCFNELPIDIQSERNYDFFKQKLKKHFTIN